MVGLVLTRLYDHFYWVSRVCEAAVYAASYKDEERLGLDARGWLRGFTMANLEQMLNAA